MAGPEIGAVLIPLSLSMAAGSMITDNPTAKRVLGIGSLASGLGSAFAGAPGAAAATSGAAAGAGTVGEKAAEAAAATGSVAKSASAAAPGFGQRLMDVMKSGTIPLGRGKLPLAVPFGLASMAMPRGPGKKALGGLGLGLGLAGTGMNLFNSSPDMSVAGQLSPEVFSNLSSTDILRLEEMMKRARMGL